MGRVARHHRRLHRIPSTDNPGTTTGPARTDQSRRCIVLKKSLSFRYLSNVVPRDLCGVTGIDEAITVEICLSIVRYESHGHIGNPCHVADVDQIISG